MKLRYVTAVLGGMLSEILTLATLWLWSDMGLGGMFFFSILAYILTWMGIMSATEPKKRQRTRWELQIYKLETKPTQLIEEELIEECV